MKTYERIKNLGRGYLASAALGASLLLGGCGGDSKEQNISLPISTEASEKIKEVEKERELAEHARKILYDSKLEEVVDKFNQDISDGRLTCEEQYRFYSAFNEAFNIKKTSERELEIPAGTQRLYDLISENIEGLDMGTPELEYALRDQGLNVFVDRNFSRSDALVVSPPIALGLFTGALIVSCFTKRSVERREKTRKMDS